VSGPLAGRVAVHELSPFSWAERTGAPPATALRDLFTARSSRDLVRRWPRRAAANATALLRRQILAGGYPVPALSRSDRVRRTWFDGYRQTYVERDVREITSIENIPDFDRLHHLLALRSAQILNFSELSRGLGIPFSTIRRYFDILRQTYQFFLVEPYHANLGKRLVKTPKVYGIDTGAIAIMTGVADWRALEQQNRVGAMIETFVAGELRKMIALSGRPTRLSYLRTQSGMEVDFLLEQGTEVVAIEVKARAGLDPRDLAGLRGLRDLLGRRFRRGVLLHTGTETLAVDASIVAAPISVFCGVE